MFLNLFKSLTNKAQVRQTYELTRCARRLCSSHTQQKDNSKYGSTTNKNAKNDMDDDLDLSNNLFGRSSVKYEPIKKEDVLGQYKTTKPKKSPDLHNKITKPPSVRKPSRQERELKSTIITDSELGFQYLKLDLNDPRLTTLMIAARSKKRRDKDGQIVIEGRRLIQEALTSGLKLNSVIFSQKDQLMQIKDQLKKSLETQPNTKVYRVPHHDLKTWSTLTTPPGVIAIFERPSLEYIVKKSDIPTLPLTVVCDNIREPNNLGSIIRTCAALPCFQIVITKGCCDPWESKALRGGCGGHFRIPIRDDVTWESVPLTIPPELAHDCCVFLAENNLQKLERAGNANVNAVEYSEIDKIGSHNVVVIGGESHGVSADAYR